MRARRYVPLAAAVITIAGGVLAGCGSTATSSSPPPGDRTAHALPPAKQAYLDRDATQIAGGFDEPNATVFPRKDGTPGPFPFIPDPAWGGIGSPHMDAGAGVLIFTPQPPFPRMAYLIKDVWQERRSGGVYQYYAGARAWDRAQGLLKLLANDYHDGHRLPGDGTEFLTPRRAGAVRIVDAVGERLHLVAADGTDFYFDTATNVYADADGVPVATPTASTGRPTPVPTEPVPAATVTPAPPPLIELGPASSVDGKTWVAVTLADYTVRPYSGFNLHVRWDGAVFAFDSVSTLGSVLPAPACLHSVDPDGAGVVFSCASLGGLATEQAGTLAALVLAPVGSGCATLHLVTYGGPDQGDGTTGSYLADAGSGHPQAVETRDTAVDGSGRTCSPGASSSGTP